MKLLMSLLCLIFLGCNVEEIKTSADLKLKGNAVVSRSKDVKFWNPGQNIYIKFLDGTEKQKEEVRKIAPQWTKYANLNFIFLSDNQKKNVDVTITFKGTRRSSQIGKKVFHPTKMRLGNMSSIEIYRHGTILHEFGHMLGLDHEHQRSDRPFKIDEEKAENLSKKNSIGVDNYTGKIKDEDRLTKYDVYSVMHYDISDKIIVGKKKQHYGSDRLTVFDKKGIIKLYPGRILNRHQFTEEHEKDLLDSQRYDESLKVFNACFLYQEENGPMWGVEDFDREAVGEVSRYLYGDLYFAHSKMIQDPICKLSIEEYADLRESYNSYGNCKLLMPGEKSTDGRYCPYEGYFLIVSADGKFLGAKGSCQKSRYNAYKKMKSLVGCKD